MEWMGKRTSNYPDVSVTNFTESLADGKALLAILDDYDPSESPYEPTESAADNLRRWSTCLFFTSYIYFLMLGSVM